MVVGMGNAALEPAGGRARVQGVHGPHSSFILPTNPVPLSTATCQWCAGVLAFMELAVSRRDKH